MLDEMERSMHDALCVVKRTLESNRVVPGGGCIEAALSIYLENYATSIASREQLAIAEFAQSLLVIPKVLLFFFLFFFDSSVLKIFFIQKKKKDSLHQRSQGRYRLGRQTACVPPRLANRPQEGPVQVVSQKKESPA